MGPGAIPSARRAGCTRRPRGTGLPHAMVAQAWLDRADASAGAGRAGGVPTGQERAPQAEGCGPSAGREARRAGLDGLPALAARVSRCSTGTGSTSTCRRPGGTSMPRQSSPATFRPRPSSSTTPACRPTAARRGWPAGAAPWSCWRESAKCGAEDLGPRRAGAALDAASCRGRWCAMPSAIFGVERCMFASNFPVDSLVGHLRRDLRQLPRRSRGPAGRRAPPAVPRQRGAHLSAVRNDRPMSKPAVGVIGLGLMGEGVTERLIETGHAVAGYDIVAEKVAAAAALGVRACRIAGRGRARSDIVLMSVTTTARGRGGRARRQTALPLPARLDGKVLVDHSTTEIDATKRVAAGLASSAGMAFVDAPVSGGPAAAAERHARDHGGRRRRQPSPASRPVLEQLGALHASGPGRRGQATKLVNQTLVLTNYCVIAEALRLGRGLRRRRRQGSPRRWRRARRLQPAARAVRAHDRARLRPARLRAPGAQGPGDAARGRQAHATSPMPMAAQALDPLPAADRAGQERARRLGRPRPYPDPARPTPTVKTTGPTYRWPASVKNFSP